MNKAELETVARRLDEAESDLRNFPALAAAVDQLVDLHRTEFARSRDERLVVAVAADGVYISRRYRLTTGRWWSADKIQLTRAETRELAEWLLSALESDTE